MLVGCTSSDAKDAQGDTSESSDPDQDPVSDDNTTTTTTTTDTGSDPVQDLVDLIQTDTDSAFVYPYPQSRVVPEDGKVLLIVGQTIGGIDEHVASFPDEPLPGGWAAYWGVPSLDGITSDFVNETGGRQNHQTLLDRYPNTVIQSGMWMVGTWDVAKRTADGEFDDVIRGYADWAKNANRPIYLRIGYEFDGPHNELEPEDYVNAYQHVVGILREEKVDNVAYVWHSYASAPYNGYSIEEWYPGDSYVDWVGISLFGHSYTPTPSSALDDVLDFARLKQKPVMIAEASPINGIETKGTNVWEQWFVNMFSLTYDKNIKAISFINEDWERFYFPGTDWGDARLQNNETISAAWFEETNSDRYLKQSPQLFEQLGYTP